MDISSIKKNLMTNTWGNSDYRELKNDLIVAVQNAIVGFTPLKLEEYKNNPIQLLDFFCGAGGTSLGFAALNQVVPAFKLMG